MRISETAAPPSETIYNDMAPSERKPEGRNAAIRRNANTKFFAFVLISGLLCFAAAGAVLYFVFRPHELRIAVGPPRRNISGDGDGAAERAAALVRASIWSRCQIE